jgi:hypothetical protein
VMIVGAGNAATPALNTDAEREPVSALRSDLVQRAT